MKKNTKIIDGDKIEIIEGEQVNLDDELAEEYELSEIKLKPNPYAEKLKSQNKLTVQLDSDISGYFHNSREVNSYLRKQIRLIQKLVKA